MRPVLVLLVAISAASNLGAQTPVDFSGRWTAEPPPPAPSAREAAAERAQGKTRSPDFGSGWGRTISITQDARTLTVAWPIFSAYDLQPPLQFVYALDGSETTNTINIGRGYQKQHSKVTWAGTSLVITTRHTDGEVRQTLVLDSPTSLVVETTRSGVPGSSRTVYAKGGST